LTKRNLENVSINHNYKIAFKNIVLGEMEQQIGMNFNILSIINEKENLKT